MMSRFAEWWRNHRGALLVSGVVAAASLIVGAVSVIIWKHLKLNAQTWAAAIAAVAAVGATLVALKALSYSRQSTGAADRAARAAENQTKLQEQIRIEVAQPYVWVDVRPDEATGVLLNLAVGNGGPTMATNVRVTIDPPLPTIDQLRERVEAAQARLAAGISYLPPGRTLTWPLGQGFNLLKDSGSQAHTFTVNVDGPFGPCPR